MCEGEGGVPMYYIGTGDVKKSMSLIPPQFLIPLHMRFNISTKIRRHQYIAPINSYLL